MSRFSVFITFLFLLLTSGLLTSGLAMASPMQEADTLELPFFDDFSYNQSVPDGKLWRTNGVKVNTNLPKDPPSTGVLLFDALDGNGNFYPNAHYGATTPADTIESLPINLLYPGNRSIYLSYSYQRGGLGDAPEEADSLVLEFYSPTERQWNTIKSYTGGKCEPFRQEIIQISESKYLQKGFRFRFRNYISLGSQLAPDLVSNCDHWMVDYVTINKNRTETDTVYSDVALTAMPEVRIGDYQLVPWMHYKKLTTKPDLKYLIKYRNNDSKARLLDSINLYLSHYGITDKYALGTYNMPGSMDFDNENTAFKYELRSESDSEAIYKIDVRLVSDALSTDYPANNSLSIEKRLSNTYAYDDGSAEAAYGLQGEGSSGGLVAIKYHTMMPDMLMGIYMYFCPVYQNRQALSFNLKIWGCKNGEPGEVLYTKRNVQVPKTDTEKFVLIPIDDIVEVADTFYIGWEKNENAMIAVGFDKNTTSVNPKYYNIGGKWKQSKEPGQVMMRPAFQYLTTATSDRPTVSDISPKRPKLSVYPNPASSYVRIKGAVRDQKIMIISASGKPVMEIEPTDEETEIQISGLAKGTYIIYQPASKASAKFIKAN